MGYGINLYTGDISPDESEFFALENGKHFYIYSLKDYSLKLRVTLPRTYKAIDVCGFFSDDGMYLYVPVEKYVENEYRYWLCKYDTKSYSLLEMNRVKNISEYHWKWF